MERQLEPLHNGFIDQFQRTMGREMGHYFYEHCFKKKPPGADPQKFQGECRKRKPVEKYALQSGLRNALDSTGSEDIQECWIETMVKLFPDYSSGFHESTGSRIPVNGDPWRPFLQKARGWSRFYTVTDEE